MSLAALWADVRETRRLDAHCRRVRREFADARRAAAPRESFGVRASFFALGWFFKGTAFALKWGVPALGAWGGVREGKFAGSFVVPVAVVYLVAACIMGQSSVPGSVFSVSRYPSRISLLLSEFARRAPALLWWGAMAAVVAGRLGATSAVAAACAMVPLVAALGGAFVTIRTRIHDPALRGPFLPPLLVGMAVVALVSCGWTATTNSSYRIAAEAVFCVMTAAIGALTAHAVLGRVGWADVPLDGDEPEAELPRRRGPASSWAVRNAGATSAPGAGLLRAHWGTLSASWASMPVRERIVACALGVVWLLAAPVGTALQGPTATTFEFPTLYGGITAVFLKNVFAVRYPSRLALYGVTPRALRLFDLGSFLLAVALPTALFAAGSLAWLGTPSPLWLRLYGGVAAVFVLRMGWDGFEIMGRDEGAARRWSLPLRLLAVAAFVAIPTSVGAVPCAALGVVGLAWLLTHLDAPIWDSDGEDRPIRLRRS